MGGEMRGESDHIAPDDRGYLYGDGLFETIAVQGGRVRWLERHIARLWRSGRALGFGDEALRRGEQTLRACAVAEEGMWRVTVTRPGEGAPFGGQGSVTRRWRPRRPPSRPHLTILEGWYLPDDPLAEHKTTSYMRVIEAWRLVHQRGADEGVRVSRDGRVGCACSANIILATDGVLYTPPVQGILPGVTREGLIQLAEARGAPIIARALTLETLRAADEIILCSAGLGVSAAASIEGRPLDDALARTLRQWMEEAAR